MTTVCRVDDDMSKMIEKQFQLNKVVDALEEEMKKGGAGSAQAPDGQVITLPDLDSAIRDLREGKMERHDALGAEQQLRNTIKIMTDEMTLMKKHLVHLGNTCGAGGSDDKLTAALQAKIQSMNEAFGQRCKDMENSITSIGAAANCIAPKGLCLSCSRPTAVTDHAVRPNSPPKDTPASRPQSRQVPQRYYHKVSLSHTTWTNLRLIEVA